MPPALLAALLRAGSARQVHLYHQQKDGMTFTTPNAEIRQVLSRCAAALLAYPPACTGLALRLVP